MTDPTGKAFLSYKHEQRETASLLENAFREHGVPVWRDESNLRSEPLEAELRRVLEDTEEISSGVILVSESVADSDIILEVELPCFQKRWEADDTFFVVVVRCPDIDVETAESILAKSSSLHDLSHWYMEKLDEYTPSAAATVADFVLKHRVEQIDATLPSDHPIECSLDTYEAPAHTPDPSIKIDWSSHFEHEQPSQSVWNQRLLPSLDDVIDRINQEAPGRPLRFRGRAHLPATFSLGRYLSVTRGIRTKWMQPGLSGNPEAWTFENAEKESGLGSELTQHTVSASDLAVLISITDSVQPEVANTKSKLPEFNSILELNPEDGPGVRLNPGEAIDAAKVIRDRIRETLNERPNITKIHLFMAVPTGLAFLLGQQTNTLLPIQTYTLSEEDREYQRAVLLD